MPDEEQALYVDEICDAAKEEHGNFHPHVIYSERDGRLTASQIAATCSGGIDTKEVYLCGPTDMTESLRGGLHHLGVPLDRIHLEYFNFR